MRELTNLPHAKVQMSKILTDLRAKVNVWAALGFLVFGMGYGADALAVCDAELNSYIAKEKPDAASTREIMEKHNLWQRVGYLKVNSTPPGANLVKTEVARFV